MISFTVVSNTAVDSLDGLPLPLSKMFSVDVNGKLAKSTAAHLTTGLSERHEVRSVQEFVDLHSTLQSHQILVYGLADQSKAKVVTQSELQRLRREGHWSGEIARDGKHFAYRNGGAVLFIDYDYDPGTALTPPLTPDEIRKALIAACPELADAPMAAIASTSSFLYLGDREVQGARGWHLYVFIMDGSDIPRAGKALYERLWLAGYGRYQVSRSGRLLDRNLMDRSVWQAEREDFVGAKCIAPLEQRRPPAKVWNPDSPLFDSHLITEPNTQERADIEKSRRNAKAAVDGQRQAAENAWISEISEKIAARCTDRATAERTACYAAQGGVLLGDFELTMDDGSLVTVAHVLANRSKFHARRCCDPLEPEYRNDNRIGYLDLQGGRRSLYSHAHGGQRFTLYPHTRALKMLRGEKPRQVDEILEAIRECGDVFAQPVGGGKYRLVHVSEGHIVEVTSAWLRLYIGRLFRCEQFDTKSGWRPMDVPKDLPDLILADVSDRQLPVLEAVVRDPVMRRDGSILDTPGYSARDRLLYDPADLERAPIPAHPTNEQIQLALETLMGPFERFPFVDDDARAAMLAACLTAVVRPMLDTSPAFLWEAPSVGSGKTKAASSVASLVTGARAVPRAPPVSDEEQNKTLFAAVRIGSRVIYWDNVVQPIYGNASLSAFLTAANFSSRVLGVSVEEEYPNRALMLLTGNNARIEGDACRRIVRCKIDAQMERPSLRVFALDPESFVLEHRTELWAAALTILRGFMSRGAPKQTADTAGSFEHWDRTVRQCVIWLGRSGLGEMKLGDPYRSAIESIDNDPLKDVILNVMRAWRDSFGDVYMSAGEVLGERSISSANQSLALTSALAAIEAGRGPLTAQRLGYWLQKHCDERVGGLYIKKDRDPKSGSWRYAVVKVGTQTELHPAFLASLPPEVRCYIEGDARARDVLAADPQARTLLETDPATREKVKYEPGFIRYLDLL